MSEKERLLRQDVFLLSFFMQYYWRGHRMCKHLKTKTDFPEQFCYFKGPVCCQYLMNSGPWCGPRKATKAWHWFIQNLTILSLTETHQPRIVTGQHAAGSKRETFFFLTWKQSLKSSASQSEDLRESLKKLNRNMILETVKISLIWEMILPVIEDGVFCQ